MTSYEDLYLSNFEQLKIIEEFEDENPAALNNNNAINSEQDLQNISSSSLQQLDINYNNADIV